MTSKCNAQARRWLAERSAVPARHQRALAALAPDLLSALPHGDCWLLGINGPPGTGKSTLAAMLAAVDEAGHSGHSERARAPIVVLSLDDYYLSREDRQRLAAKIHPGLAQRGVPGTHDLTRLFEDIDRLLAGHTGRLTLPVFSKGRDEPRQRGRELVLDGRPARVILEGWFVGIPPLQDRSRSGSSGNETHDAFGGYVAKAHEVFHKDWSRRATALWTLTAPDFNTVVHWRWQQEQELPASQRMLDSPAAVRQFLQPFEALVRYQLLEGAQWADLIVQLDKDHCPHLQCPP